MKKKRKQTKPTAEQMGKAIDMMMSMVIGEMVRAEWRQKDREAKK